MSIRTTVTLDDDVMERVQRHARSLGKPFKEALDELLRTWLLGGGISSRKAEIPDPAVPHGLSSGIELR